jgi:hypothetical protein
VGGTNNLFVVFGRLSFIRDLQVFVSPDDDEENGDDESESGGWLCFKRERSAPRDETEQQVQGGGQPVLFDKADDFNFVLNSAVWGTKLDTLLKLLAKRREQDDAPWLRFCLRGLQWFANTLGVVTAARWACALCKTARRRENVVFTRASSVKQRRSLPQTHRVLQDVAVEMSGVVSFSNPLNLSRATDNRS